MGSLAVSKDKWTIFGSYIYVDLDQNATVPLAIPMPVEAELKLDLKQFISTFGAAYQVVDTGKTTFNLLAGGRYLSIDADLKYDIESVASGLEKESGSNWDFDDDAMIKDMTMKGPYAGIKFRF